MGVLSALFLILELIIPLFISISSCCISRGNEDKKMEEIIKTANLKKCMA